MTTIARNGTTLVCVGQGGVRCYAGVLPDDQTTKWLEKQVRAWSNDADRLQVATRMYEMRFDTQVPEGTTLAQLRGFEGDRMKAFYRAYAEKSRTGKFRRSYNPANWDEQDPVNKALSAANICLYGVVHAAIIALGCSPALGFIHTGKQHSFVYDIADLYKTEVTIPLAFKMHASDDPERAVRRKLREEFRLYRLMPKVVGHIQELLDPKAKSNEDELETDLLSLWDPDAGALPAGVNYGKDPS
jgi:CRISPR-associated protein Cas1